LGSANFYTPKMSLKRSSVTRFVDWHITESNRRDRQEGHGGAGLVGSQFITTIHAQALKMVPNAAVRAMVSLTAEHARTFASRHGIPNHFTELDAMLAMDDIDLVMVGTPNLTHCEITTRAARAGRHVVVEKPLCMNLTEADRMINVCAACLPQFVEWHYFNYRKWPITDELTTKRLGHIVIHRTETAAVTCDTVNDEGRYQ
jgi:hypothetical protein